MQVGRERADHIGGFHTRRAEHAGRERGHGAELSEMLRQLLAQVARDHDAVDRVRADGVGRDRPVAETDNEHGGVRHQRQHAAQQRGERLRRVFKRIVLTPQQRVEREGVVVADRFT